MNIVDKIKTVVKRYKTVKATTPQHMIYNNIADKYAGISYSDTYVNKLKQNVTKIVSPSLISWEKGNPVIIPVSLEKIYGSVRSVTATTPAKIEGVKSVLGKYSDRKASSIFLLIPHIEVNRKKETKTTLSVYRLLYSARLPGTFSKVYQHPVEKSTIQDMFNYLEKETLYSIKNNIASYNKIPPTIPSEIRDLTINDLYEAIVNENEKILKIITRK